MASWPRPLQEGLVASSTTGLASWPRPLQDWQDWRVEGGARGFWTDQVAEKFNFPLVYPCQKMLYRKDVHSSRFVLLIR